MIRQSRISDKEALLKLWKEGYGDTPFSEMEYDRLHVHRWFAICCEFQDHFFSRVVEKDGEVVGILMGVVDKNFWGKPTGQTLVSYSRHDSDKLIRQFIRWCKERGAEQVTITTATGKDRYKQLVEAFGFEETGRLYTKEI